MDRGITTDGRALLVDRARGVAGKEGFAEDTRRMKPRQRGFWVSLKCRVAKEEVENTYKPSASIGELRFMPSHCNRLTVSGRT